MYKIFTLLTLAPLLTVVSVANPPEEGDPSPKRPLRMTEIHEASASMGTTPQILMEFFPISTILNGEAHPSRGALESVLQRFEPILKAEFFGRYMIEEYQKYLTNPLLQQQSPTTLPGTVTHWLPSRVEEILNTMQMTENELVEHFPFARLKKSGFGKAYGFLPPPLFGKIHTREVQLNTDNGSLNKYFMHSIQRTQAHIKSLMTSDIDQAVVDSMPPDVWRALADTVVEKDDKAVVKAQKLLRLALKFKDMPSFGLTDQGKKDLLWHLYLSAAQGFETAWRLSQQALEKNPSPQNERQRDDLKTSAEQVMEWAKRYAPGE